MVHIREIKDLEALRGRPASPPYVLLESAETCEERGEPWRVIEARVDSHAEPSWLLLPEDGTATLFIEDEVLVGRWDQERQAFF